MAGKRRIYFHCMFEYEKFGRFTAIVHEGMEPDGEIELQNLGAKKTKQVYSAIHFDADLETLYRINYCSRLAIRVLAPLLTFDCHSSRYLRKTAQTMDWEQFLTIDTTFAITATVSNSKANHSLFVAQVLKDGIADAFREKYGKRPSVDIRQPDVRLNLRIHKNRAAIALDTSGESLHKRGYRKRSVKAPLQEALAAALVHKSEWNGDRPFWDPMCGSGTILCEALMKYCRIPSQYLRTQFGFERMPGFDRKRWETIKRDADAAIRDLPQGLISGSDISAESVKAARTNLCLLPSGRNVHIYKGSFQDTEPCEHAVIVTNPPYGVRLGTTDEVIELYRDLGNMLKKKCTGSSAFVYVGNPALRKNIGLKPAWRFALKNGPVTGELVRIDSYKVVFHDGTRQASQHPAADQSSGTPRSGASPQDQPQPDPPYHGPTQSLDLDTPAQQHLPAPGSQPKPQPTTRQSASFRTAQKRIQGIRPRNKPFKG